ncbi:ATP-binding protein [Nostoc cycadae]|uniref:ATP-binding protein n=1 Tax=Nostoc cycadae TaxID=246795 RepID=UPI0011AF5427|nr:ATP-binding protein [Nostoc cycadae]
MLRLLTNLKLAANNTSGDPIAILERIVAGKHTEADLLLLRHILIVGKNQQLMQLGKYNVNIGQGQDIQIGDRIYKGSSAETIRQVFQEVLETSRLRSLVTHNEFAARVEQVLTNSQGLFVGRESIRQELKDFLVGSIRVIVIHGSGGLGKTRLLLSLPEIVPEGRSLWYVRNTAESIEPDLVSLEREHQHIIVVDDAHRFNLLPQLREVLVNPEFASKVTLILATRSVFKDSILYQLGTLLDNQFATVEVKPLSNQDINQILEASPYNIAEEDIRYAIVKTAEGNPLFAGIAARLVQQGKTLANLSREQILTNYLDEIIKDLAEVNDGDRQFYIRYLQILAALGSINLGEEELQGKIYEVIGISEIDEPRIIARLMEAGIIEKYWKTIKLSSEVLADHILITQFFAQQTRRADYQKLIIEPFFNLKPKEILRNLAEAEIKGESSEAGSLLTYKLNEFSRLVQHEGNCVRFNLLNWLKDVAYLRAEDVISIVALIVDAPELPPQNIPDEFWEGFQISHEWVLSSVIEILERTIYRGGLHNSIIYLHKLATYKLETQEYWVVRDKARKALGKIAEFQRNKSYDVQLILLEFISNWLKENCLTNLPLSLPLLQCMLKIDFHSAEINPIQVGSIVIYRGDLIISDTLKQIREHSLGILYTAYQQAQDLPTRLQIVQVLCNGATPYLSSREQVSTKTRNQLCSDCAKTADFFSNSVMKNAELPILDKLAEWSSQAKKIHKYQSAELDILQQNLKDHKTYQLYRLLVGRYRLDDEENQINLQHFDGKHAETKWQQAQEQKQQKINEYVQSISTLNLEKFIQELDTIANQNLSIGKNNTFGLNDLLRLLGETQTEISQSFIDKIITNTNSLKHHLGFVLAGVRLSNQELARTYVRSWIEQDDTVLWVAIAISYRYIDWSQPQLEEEWHILRQLVAKESPVLDPAIFWSLQQLAPYNSDLVVELLKTLATRGNENILCHVAETVSWQIGSNNEYAVQFNDTQDLIEIISNFERLSRLDYDAEECLKRLGDIAPMQLIDFIERRIKANQNQYYVGNFYEAFPKPFSSAFDHIQSKSEYPEILRRVRNWMLENDEFLLSLEAPALLQALSMNLAGELYKVLVEWIDAGDIDKLKAVVKIIREFNSGQEFYDLSREIILRTQNEDVKSYIYGAINSTPDVVEGAMSKFYQQRIEEVLPWLTDDNIHVKLFARQIIQSLQINIESEEGVQKLRERNW